VPREAELQKYRVYLLLSPEATEDVAQVKSARCHLDRFFE
jgi:hypothetical protein